MLLSGLHIHHEECYWLSLSLYLSLSLSLSVITRFYVAFPSTFLSTSKKSKFMLNEREKKNNLYKPVNIMNL